MEIIEPLWFTIETVHDLIKANRDIASELQDLGDTIKLISFAVKPLIDTIKELEDKQTTELKEVFSALRNVLEDAEKTLKQMQEEKRSRFYFLTHAFGARGHIDEIKAYQDKLKTLIPIMNLAISSATHHSGQHSNNNNNANFSATKLLKNDKARPFWIQHFGDQEYKVSWSRFVAAFEHHFAKEISECQKLKNLGGSSSNNNNNNEYSKFKVLKRRLDKNGDDEVDIYEYDMFTTEMGLWDSFLALLDNLKESQEEENTFKTHKNNVLKRKSEDDIGVSKPNPSITITNTDNTEGYQNLKKSKSDIENEEDGYKLTLIGKTHVTNNEGCKEIGTVNQSWKENEVFTLGRAFFAKLPAELLVRISRQHCQITCKLNPESKKKEYWIKDTSGNGTYINGKLLGQSNSKLLEDDDRIGILMLKPALMEIELGYLFTPKLSSVDGTNKTL